MGDSSDQLLSCAKMTTHMLSGSWVAGTAGKSRYAGEWSEIGDENRIRIKSKKSFHSHVCHAKSGSWYPSCHLEIRGIM